MIRSRALKLWQICVQPRQEILIFFSVMAAKRFQVPTEEESEQLIRDKNPQTKQHKMLLKP